MQIATVDQERIALIYQGESRRVLATLIRLLGCFDLAEEALQEAFAAAVIQWPKEGLPQNPRAWLVSAGRFKAIDQLRRRTRDERVQDELARHCAEVPEADLADEDGIGDDRLRLIFTCCHPSLAPEARIALTLREVCDLSTEEIARAFLTATATVAQRIVRAKRKIRAACIPYSVPATQDLAERLQGVLQVIYLIFNEGYNASSGADLIRPALCQEAVRLARLLMELLPEPEVAGLLALMLMHHSRFAARTTGDGELVRLDEQDRNLWDRPMIAEAATLIEASLRSGRYSIYTLQAAIAAVHAEAPTADRTDWAQIVGLYGVLQGINPSPVVALNRAVAIAMHHGPEAGLLLLDCPELASSLQDYYLLYAARADLLSRLSRTEEAAQCYRLAISKTLQEPERRFLQRRLDALVDLPAD